MKHMIPLTYESKKSQNASKHFYYKYLHKQRRISCISERGSAAGDTDTKATKKITQSNSEPAKE